MLTKIGLNSEKQAVFTLTIKVSETSGEGEGWKLMTSGTKRKDPAPPQGYNCKIVSTTHEAEGKPDVPASKEPGPPNPKPCETTRKKQ